MRTTLDINDALLRDLRARAAVMSWSGAEHVRLLSPCAETIVAFFDLLDQAGTGGNFSTDAMTAALAMEYGGCVYSNDRDFGRFSRVTVRNPLARA